MNTKSIVMSRVRAVHAMRPLVSTAALCALLVVVSVYAISQKVWVGHIIANMPSVTDVSALTRFFAAAFLNTSYFVKAFSIVALGSGIWFAREIARMLGELSSARTILHGARGN